MQLFSVAHCRERNLLFAVPPLSTLPNEVLAVKRTQTTGTHGAVLNQTKTKSTAVIPNFLDVHQEPSLMNASTFN